MIRRLIYLAWLTDVQTRGTPGINHCLLLGMCLRVLYKCSRLEISEIKLSCSIFRRSRCRTSNTRTDIGESDTVSLIVRLPASKPHPTRGTCLWGTSSSSRWLRAEFCSVSYYCGDVHSLSLSHMFVLDSWAKVKQDISSDIYSYLFPRYTSSYPTAPCVSLSARLSDLHKRVEAFKARIIKVWGRSV